ncbi:hepatocyte nuclear factor 6-like isoform X2 [Paramacrobiotus metropolitanus]|uniref:hepatocyte nuclear factor 6-like isoform X2 n=1 Tax=Paramacrobiotus metropolitanus TaxID=2943436 RepID=UPI002445A724|nr:hepatocyte nuclear factor 6-like isoform X2 [Paramacrobiotus metropolitanus]
MYNVNSMNRAAAAHSYHQSRSPASYQNSGRYQWWLPVVPEMDAIQQSDGLHDSGGVSDGGGSGNGSSDPLMSAGSGHDLGSRSPNMTNSALSDSTEFRVNAFSGNAGSYATLTPLQPLPPIASVSEKFSHNPVATPQGFHFITPNHQLSVHNITNTYQYAAGSFAPLTAISAHQAAAASAGIGGYTGAYSHNGLQSPKSFSPSNGFENHIALAAANSLNYPTPQRHNLAGSTSPFSSANLHSNNGVSLTIQLAGGLSVQSSVFGQSQQASQHSQDSENSHHHDRGGGSPSNLNGSHSPPGTPTSSPHSTNGNGNNHNGQIVVDNSPANSVMSATSHSHGSSAGMGNTNGSAAHGNKHHAAHRTTSHSSSGNKNANNNTTAAGATGSDEAEDINTKDLAQRISAELKRYSIPQAIFAQRVLCRSQGTLSDLLRNPKPWSKLKSGRETFRRMAKWLEEPEYQRMGALRVAGNWTSPQPAPVGVVSPVVPQVPSKRKQENPTPPPSHSSPEPQQQQPKKPRLVFTDIQRRTLQQIFKETKRPNKEMQLAISQQLGLELSTVGNFFMNARRRSQDKWQDEGDKEKAKEGKASKIKKEPAH